MNVLVQRGSLKRVTSVLAVTALTAGVGILGTAQPALANHGTVDTKAFGVDTNGLVNTAPTPLCPLVFGERFCEKEVAGVDVPGVLTTGVLKVRAEGTHDPLKADSEATVAEVVALPGTAGSPALTANLVTSRCTADEMGLVGDTVIADIDILGVEPTETELTDPPPNFEVVDIPGVLFIILNEQIISPNGEKITVNAIRIVVAEGTDQEQEIIISQSVCSFHPADAPPPAGTGFLEICKRADNGNGAVTGRFRFRFDGRGVTVPVGSCSGPIEVPAGRLTVREVQKDGVRMVAA